jgi:hypothetical protein
MPAPPKIRRFISKYITNMPGSDMLKPTGIGLRPANRESNCTGLGNACSVIKRLSQLGSSGFRSMFHEQTVHRHNRPDELCLNQGCFQLIGPTCGHGRKHDFALLFCENACGEVLRVW